MCKWIKWDGTGRSRPFLDENFDNIYYMLQYISHGRYDSCETNQKIQNLKKKPNRPSNELYYKNEAIHEFAHDLASILTDVKKPCYITWIPPSKANTDEEYDDRIEQVVRLACEQSREMIPVEIFKRNSSAQSLHTGGQRNPHTISSNWDFIAPTPNNPDIKDVIVVDDVITTGATMRAAFDLISSALPDVTKIGIAWAIVIDNPDVKSIFNVDTE